MKTTIISEGWDKIDLNRIKTINSKIDDFNWIFELLGWEKSGKREKRRGST